MRSISRNALVILLSILPLFPLWYFQYLPVQDYPNHFARLSILRELSSSDFYQNFFYDRPASLMSPLTYTYLTLDMLVTKAFWFIDVDTAMRAFLTLYVILYLTGLFVLSKQLRVSFSAVTILNLPLIYSSFFHQGFMNFVFSIPFFILSLWALERYRTGRDKRYLLILFFFLILTYVTHIFTFLAFWIYILTLFISDGLKTKGALILIFLMTLFILSGTFYILREYIFEFSKEAFLFKLLLLPIPFAYLPASMNIIAAALYLASLYLLARNSPVTGVYFLRASVIFIIVFILVPSVASVGYIDARFLFFSYLLITFSYNPGENPHARIPKFIIALVYLAGLVYFVVSGSQFNRSFSTSCQQAINDKSVVLPVSAAKVKTSLLSPYLHAWGYFFRDKQLAAPYIFSLEPISLKYRNKLEAPDGLWAFNDRVQDFIARKDYIRNIYDYILVVGDNPLILDTVSNISSEICSDGIVRLFLVKKDQ